MNQPAGCVKLLLVMLALCSLPSGACAQGIAGVWGSALYRAELSVSGGTVRGTFTSLLDPQGAPGTITGSLQDAPGLFRADWTQPLGAGHGDFGTLLALGSDGRVLTGYRWAGESYPTSFSLHRVVNGQIPQLADLDALDSPPSASPPPAAPAAPPPASATGQLVICRSVQDGEPVGEGTAFERLSEVWVYLRYRDQAAGVAECVWRHEGRELSRGERQIPGGNGWVAFSVRSGDAQGLPSGQYTVTLFLPQRGAAQAQFTLGSPAAAAPSAPASAPAQQPGESLAIGTGTEGGRLAGAATRFHNVSQLVGCFNYKQRPVGEVEGVWHLDGTEMGRGRQTISAGDGRAWFGYRREGGQTLRPGRYRLELSLGGRPIAAQEVTVTSGDGVG